MGTPSPGHRGLAVVTGGGGSIGEAISRALHGDGWRVAIGYVTRDRAEKLAADLDPDHSTSFALPLDMTDAKGIKATMAQLFDDFGRVDAIVFNGGAARGSSFLETTEDDSIKETAV